MEMNTKSFVSRWSGSPLVTAARNALLHSSLPAECQEFFLTVGLPSNALWFDPASRAIMCFDGVATLRDLGESDVSATTWRDISAMGRLIIVGVYSAAFVVVDRTGSVILIQGGDTDAIGSDVGWTPSTFVNHKPWHFADCLVEYKQMVEIFKGEAYNFQSPAIRQAVLKFKDSVAMLDPETLKNENGYWSQIIDHLDVW